MRVYEGEEMIVRFPVTLQHARWEIKDENHNLQLWIISQSQQGKSCYCVVSHHWILTFYWSAFMIQKYLMCIEWLLMERRNYANKLTGIKKFCSEIFPVLWYPRFHNCVLLIISGEIKKIGIYFYLYHAVKYYWCFFLTLHVMFCFPLYSFIYILVDFPLYWI